MEMVTVYVESATVSWDDYMQEYRWEVRYGGFRAARHEFGFSATETGAVLECVKRGAAEKEIMVIRRKS